MMIKTITFYLHIATSLNELEFGLQLSQKPKQTTLLVGSLFCEPLLLIMSNNFMNMVIRR
jgi:hypothetical protein